MCTWVELIVLWGNCSVLCKMYQRGKEVVREWLWQPGISRAPRLGFQTPQFKRDIQHVMSSVSVIAFCEREQKSAEFKNIYSPRSPSPLIDMDKFPPPPCVTRARACLTSMCLRSVRVPRRPSPLLLKLQLVDSAWTWKVRAYRCQAGRGARGKRRGLGPAVQSHPLPLSFWLFTCTSVRVEKMREWGEGQEDTVDPRK